MPGPLRLLLAVCLGIALYALVGFQVVPRIARRQAIELVRERYGRELRLGDVRVQPFTFAIEVRDLSMPDVDGQLLLGAQRVYVNFEPLASLWRRAYVFDEIDLVSPKLRAIVRADGRLNLTDLTFAAEPARNAPTHNTAPPALAIRRLTVTAGALELIDRAREVPFAQTFSPVAFQLNHFRTTSEGGAFALSARSEPARFWWRGSVTLSPQVSSVGRFVVSGMQASVLAAYLDDALPFAVPSGALDVNGTYRVQLGKVLDARVQLSQLRLTKLALAARKTPSDQISIASLNVADVALSLQDKRLDVQRVRVRGLATRAVLEHDGKLNLMRLFPAPKATQPHDGAAWQVRLRTLILEEAALELEDRAIEPPVALRVVSLGLEVRDLTLDPSLSVPFSLKATLDDASTLRVSGSATPATQAAELLVELEHVRLARAQPYVQPYADLTIHAGLLDATANLVLRPGLHDEPSLELKAGVVVSDLRTTDNLQQQPFVDIARLELTKVRYQRAPERLQIEHVRLDRPYARLVLSAQQVLNMSAILHGGERRGPAPVARPVARIDRHASGGASEPSGSPARPPTSLHVEHPLSQVQLAPTVVEIGSVAVQDMRLSFTDHYIRPNFATELHGLHGTLDKLSSAPDSLASLALRGTLGESAPVSISGRLSPFAYDKFSDLSVSWKNVPLAVFNPYSDRFAGYSIVRGDLATSLRYKMRNGKLDAQHHIRVDQLTWGEATATKEQAALPVRLATAMLRDRQGVISVDVPVQGSLDDPTFRIAPLIWQALKNVCLKAVMAPFDWLGSLVAGAEKARFVDFSPGDDALGDAARKQLVSLGQALSARPSLSVDVPLGVDRALDRSALVERKYQRALTAAIAGEQWGKSKSSPFSALDLGDQLDVLEALYETLTGREAKLPDAPALPEASWRERRAARRRFQVAALERMSRAAIKVEESELEALGLRRADAIESVLVREAHVDDQRVLVSSNGNVRGEGGKVRFELTLK